MTDQVATQSIKSALINRMTDMRTRIGALIGYGRDSQFILAAANHNLRLAHKWLGQTLQYMRQGHFPDDFSPPDIENKTDRQEELQQARSMIRQAIREFDSMKETYFEHIDEEFRETKTQSHDIMLSTYYAWKYLHEAAMELEIALEPPQKQTQVAGNGANQ